LADPAAAGRGDKRPEALDWFWVTSVAPVRLAVCVVGGGSGMHVLRMDLEVAVRVQEQSWSGSVQPFQSHRNQLGTVKLDVLHCAVRLGLPSLPY